MWVSESKRAACAAFSDAWNQLDAASIVATAKIQDALRGRVADVLINARAKSKASYFKKVLGLPEGSDFWGKIGDKIGARVIVESTVDIPKVDAALVAAGFQVLDRDDQVVKRDPRKLKYAGYHLQVSHPAVTLADGTLVPFEVQVRTRSLHAWSETEHRLVYKSLVNLDEATEHRLERLLVLVELFDEELAKGIGEVESMPEYALGRFYRRLESQYLEFAELPGDDETSFEVLGTVARGKSATELEEWSQELDDYIARCGGSISAVMADLGPNSPDFDPTRYWLLSQPESLLVLYLLSTKPMYLTATVQGSDLEDDVREIAANWQPC